MSYFVGDKHYSEVIIDAMIDLGWTRDKNKGISLYARLTTEDDVKCSTIGFVMCERSRYLKIWHGFDRAYEIDGRRYAEHKCYKRAAEDLTDLAKMWALEHLTGEVKQTKPVMFYG